MKDTDTNYELFHFGIKGMKWGVRRYQNADGSLTDAGKKRLAESVARNTSYGRFHDTLQKYPTYSQKKVSEMPEVQDAFSKLATARGKYYKSMDVATKFNNDNALVKKYQEKAAREEAKKLGITDEKEIKNMIWGYQNDDFDQGSDNSFSWYLKDKGINRRQFEKNVSDAAEEYNTACRQAVDVMLGEHGNITVNSYKNTRGDKTFTTTAKDIVNKALENLTDDERFRKGIYIPD